MDPCFKYRQKKEAAKVAQQAVVHVLPEQWAKAVSKAVEDGQLQGWLVLAGGAWILLRPRDRDGERANSEQDSQYSQPFHARIIVRQ